MKIDLSKSSYKNCPSFDKCNCNKCPLHPEHLKLINFSEDKLIFGWKKCRCSKRVRMKIADSFKLKNKGLTAKELDSMNKSIQMKQDNFSNIDKNLEMANSEVTEHRQEVKG